MKHILVLCALILLPLFANASDPIVRTVAVQGKAEKEFSPDIASFSVNIIARADKREKAKFEHDKMLKSLLDFAKSLDIADKDLSTGFSSVRPNYEYQHGKRKFIDYSAQTSVNIILRDLKNIATLQDKMIAAGFESFDGPNYSLDNMSLYRDEILANAVENAKVKAQSIAKKMGDKVGKAVEINEVGGYNSSPQPMRYKTMGMAAASMEVAQPSGVINITAEVVAKFILE